MQLTLTIQIITMLATGKALPWELCSVAVVLMLLMMMTMIVQRFGTIRLLRKHALRGHSVVAAVMEISEPASPKTNQRESFNWQRSLPAFDPLFASTLSITRRTQE